MIIYRFFLRYKDEFSLQTENGTIEIFDLDDNNILLESYGIRDGAVVSKADPRTHFCDKNQNGNVTYGECTNCMYQACFQNTQCAAQCIIYQILTQSCFASINAACFIISIIY